MKPTLVELNQEYEAIMHSNLSSFTQTVKLAELMTKIEESYYIPWFKETEHKQPNKALLALYRKISESRIFV